MIVDSWICFSPEWFPQRRPPSIPDHEALPAPIRDHLRRNRASNRRRIAEMKTEFGSLNCRFKAAGVDYVVLKGFTLIPDFCPDASLRSQYDYDYLVRPESVGLAQRTL